MRKLPQSSASEERTGRAIRPPTRYSSPTGSHDGWLAGQMAKEIRAVGASTFLDETDIPKGSPNFKKVIRDEIAASRELVALFTPWSMMRSWVWIEIGAAWSRAIPVVVVLFGMDLADLEKSGQGRAILEDINVVHLNDFDDYLRQLEARIKGAQS